MCLSIILGTINLLCPKKIPKVKKPLIAKKYNIPYQVIFPEKYIKMNGNNIKLAIPINTNPILLTFSLFIILTHSLMFEF